MPIPNHIRPAYPEKKLTMPDNHRFRDYFIIILIILYEDSPFFLLSYKQLFWFIIFCVLLLLNLRKKVVFNKRILLILLWVWILILFQYILFNGELTPAVLYKPFLIFYTPYLVFTLIGIKYFKYLFNIIFIVAVYTLIIYILQHISPAFNNFLIRAYDFVLPFSGVEPSFTSSILIYTEPSESGFFLLRNAGIFHEPGAYSIYLMLAVVLNTYFTGKPFNWKNIFLMIVLLTTFSTAGYVMLFIFLSYAFIISRTNLAWKTIILIPFTLLALYIYTNTNFLKQKTENQLENETQLVEKNEKSQRGRFYAFGMSVNSFLESPLIGRGILYQHRYDVGPGGSFGYGFGGLFAMFGSFFGLFYMITFYRGFLRMNQIFSMTKFHSAVVFLIINLGLLTQVFFFNLPFIYFFIIGMFMPYPKFEFKTQNSYTRLYNREKKLPDTIRY